VKIQFFEVGDKSASNYYSASFLTDKNIEISTTGGAIILILKEKNGYYC
jgi:hypothetical protein